MYLSKRAGREEAELGDGGDWPLMLRMKGMSTAVVGRRKETWISEKRGSRTGERPVSVAGCLNAHRRH